jgi:hypothetical protein
MEKRTEAKMARKEFHVDDNGRPTRSDHLAIVKAYEEFAKRLSRRDAVSSIRHWCRTKFLSFATLHSMRSTISEFDGYLTSMGFLTEQYRKNIMETHAKRPMVVLAALSSGLWPNVATVSRSSTTSGSSPTISVKNRAAAVHPSSINHGVSTEMLLHNTSCRSSGFLCYHDMMQTSKCYLRDTSIVGATAVLLLCGNGSDASVVFGRQHVIVNGWLRVRITSKAAVLIMKLRSILNTFLLARVANPTMEESMEYRELTRMMVQLLEI